MSKTDYEPRRIGMFQCLKTISEPKPRGEFDVCVVQTRTDYEPLNISRRIRIITAPFKVTKTDFKP